MNDDQQIKEDLLALSREYEAALTEFRQRAAAIVRGMRVRIIRNWNGQPYGASRPSRKRQVLTVEHVCIEHPIAVYVKDFPYDSPPLLADVEFISERFDEDQVSGRRDGV